MKSGYCARRKVEERGLFLHNSLDNEVVFIHLDDSDKKIIKKISE